MTRSRGRGDVWFVRSSFYFLPVHVWRVCWHFSNFIPTDRHRYLSRKISRSEHSVRWWQLMFSPPFQRSDSFAKFYYWRIHVTVPQRGSLGAAGMKDDIFLQVQTNGAMSQADNGIWSNKPMAKFKSSASSSLCDHFDAIVNIGPTWPMIHHHCHVVFV